jgi:hypothetical protein
MLPTAFTAGEFEVILRVRTILDHFTIKPLLKESNDIQYCESAASADINWLNECVYSIDRRTIIKKIKRKGL